MSDLEFTEDLAEVVRRIDAAADAIVDRHIAEGRTPRAVHAAQASLYNEVHRVHFRAGLLACREYMARFVAAQSPDIAASIRSNWWPGLSEDPGGPRRLHWNEVADGGEYGPWTPHDPGLSIEALPIALHFLCAVSGMSADACEAATPNRTAHCSV